MDLKALYQVYSESSGVCIDSRKIKSGEIFFALGGKHVNAAQFALTALEAGASLAIVDQSVESKDERIVKVENSLSCLQALAGYHRDKLNIPFIALTGSNGKTTTKELLAAILTRKFKVAFTHGNLNNHIGVPLTLLRVSHDVDIAVVEMGANHVGEIAFLCEIAKPTHGLITNIGKAHIGEFGSFENIIRGKSELYDYLRKTAGQVFINTNDVVLANMAKRFQDAVTYPNAGDGYTAEILAGRDFVALRDRRGKVIQSKLAGDYNFNNIAAALAVGDFFGVDEASAAHAVSNYHPQNMRSQILEKNGVKILLDAYNANPTSVHAALDYMAGYSNQPKAVVLGDMFELGEDSQKEHEAIAEKLSAMHVEKVFLVGEHMRYAHQKLPQSYHYINTEALLRSWQWENLKGMFLLVKGSRSMALERLVEI